MCSTFRKDVLEEILKEYYDERSEYYHQSVVKDVDKKAETLEYVYSEIVFKILEIVDSYKSKDEFLSFLSQGITNPEPSE